MDSSTRGREKLTYPPTFMGKLASASAMATSTAILLKDHCEHLCLVQYKGQSWQESTQLQSHDISLLPF